MINPPLKANCYTCPVVHSRDLPHVPPGTRRTMRKFGWSAFSTIIYLRHKALASQQIRVTDSATATVSGTTTVGVVA